MAKLPVTWWEIVFYGVCFLGIAAGMIFWSHFWRRRSSPARQWTEQMFKLVPPVYGDRFELGMRRFFVNATEPLTQSIGHFLYFGFSVAAATAGLALISGGILGAIHGIPLRFQALERFIVACVVGAIILTILGMSMRTTPVEQESRT